MATTKKTSAKARVSGSSLLLSLQASGFVVTILALLVAGAVILSPSLRIFAEQQQEIAELRQELARSEQEVFDLEEQLERWQDRSYVETQARERLMFVYPGDITYLVLDDIPDESTDQTPLVSTDIEVVQADWRDALLGSYLVAATTNNPGVAGG